MTSSQNWRTDVCQYRKKQQNVGTIVVRLIIVSLNHGRNLAPIQIARSKTGQQASRTTWNIRNHSGSKFFTLHSSLFTSAKPTVNPRPHYVGIVKPCGLLYKTAAV